MSWQQFLEENLLNVNLVGEACVGGLSGDIWAQSKGLGITKAQFTCLLNGFKNIDHLTANGFMIGGTKYVFIAGTDYVIHGRINRNGVQCIKANTCAIVATYDSPIVPEQIASLLEKVRNGLLQSNY